MMNTQFKLLWRAVLISAIGWTAPGFAQDGANRTETNVAEMSTKSETTSIEELRNQVRALRAEVAEMRSNWQQARAEMADLRRSVDEVQARSAPQNAVMTRPATFSQTSLSLNALQATSCQDQPSQPGDQNEAHRASLEEEYQLLSGKVDDQYQTKVESASKYRVRLSGIVLMNLASTQGTVDSIDLPMVAYSRSAGDSGGSFSATLRQSQIGLETFGPTVFGAKTSANLQLDFAGGFAPITDGVTSGLARLRTGAIRMDWTNTSLVVGQDTLFFSPNSPTSFASLAIPALSWAGNLWAWVPQIRIEHKIMLGEESSLMLQGGILDPVSGEVPGSGLYRQAGPGESSRQPAYATRIAWTRNIFGQPLRLGAGGYYSRQDYGFSGKVDGWAAMTDVELPLGRQFSLSGKFYRGRAIGGLNASFGDSVSFNGIPGITGTEVRPLNTVGGWAQLKYRPANKWEFNAAVGMDNPYASDLKYFYSPQAYGDARLGRNQAGFANLIYRPRSDMLFSAEYRRLMTYSLIDGGNGAGQVNLMMGVLF